MKTSRPGCATLLKATALPPGAAHYADPRTLRTRAFSGLADRGRMAAHGSRSRPKARPAAGQIVCLRLTGQLCADTAEALLDAVSARVQAAMPAAHEVVLDLTDTPAVDDDARAALLSLGDLLVKSHARLRLVLPGRGGLAPRCAMAAPPTPSGPMPCTRASARRCLPRMPRAPGRPSSRPPCACCSRIRLSSCSCLDEHPPLAKSPSTGDEYDRPIREILISAP